MDIVEQEIKNLGYAMEYRARCMAIAGRYKDLFTEATDGSCYSESLVAHFDSHEALMNTIKRLGGKFDRKGQEKTISYTRKDGEVEIRLCLPADKHPTCKLEEVEETIPAHMVEETKVKRFKVVCTNGEEASNGN